MFVVAVARALRLGWDLVNDLAPSAAQKQVYYGTCPAVVNESMPAARNITISSQNRV